MKLKNLSWPWRNLLQLLALEVIQSFPLLNQRKSTTRTTKFSTLTVDLCGPCPICNNFYDNHEFVVASCDHVYHLWCIAVHVQLSNTYAKVSCGRPLNQNWCINMGYKPNLNVGDQHELYEHTDGLTCI
jgi:hypothetical protein